MNKCESCLWARTALSKNGCHKVCTFSPTVSRRCIAGKNDKYISENFFKKDLTFG